MSEDSQVPAQPPSTLEERIKRTLIPPQMELARITKRELKKGEPELKLLPFLIDRNRAAMDIGANRGIWAGQMAQYCLTVWAFEPNPKLYAFMEKAVPSSVHTQQIALSNNSGQAELLIPGEGDRYSNQGASLSQTKVGDRPHMKVSVEMASLDSLDPPPTGFLKIDVEGHERAVVEGAKGLIERDRPVMIIEIEERHTGRNISEELDWIERMGYRTLILKDHRLQSRHAFDPENDHRARAGQSGYVNNFILLPGS